MRALPLILFHPSICGRRDLVRLDRAVVNKARQYRLIENNLLTASTAPRPALLLDLGAGGLADGINSLQAEGGTGERLLEHFVSIRGEGSRAPPMWGLLSLSLETSSCVIYTFFQRSGNAARERYAVVIRGVICGLS